MIEKSIDLGKRMGVRKGVKVVLWIAYIEQQLRDV